MKIKNIHALPLSIFYYIKKLILSFGEFKNKFGIDNKGMSNIRIEDIGKDISLTPKEIIMQKPVRRFRNQLVLPIPNSTLL